VDVDRIEQWTGDALLETRHDIGRADAALLAVAVVVAWAGVFAKRTLYGIARRNARKECLLDRWSWTLFRFTKRGPQGCGTRESHTLDTT
jgi:hypothetical protein